MGVIIKPDSCLSRRRAFALYALAAYVLFAFLVVTCGPAWSFEVTDAEPHGQSGAVAPITSAPAAPAGDSCLYILKTAREKSESSVMDRQYRQAAGSAAAVGLVFGVRFALGPQEVMRSRHRTQPTAAFRIWEVQEVTGGGQALAIADYRACRNEQALRALTD